MRFAGGEKNPVHENAVRCSFRLPARGRDRRGVPLQSFKLGSDPVQTSSTRAGTYRERRRIPVGQSGETHCTRRPRPHDGIRRGTGTAGAVGPEPTSVTDSVLALPGQSSRFDVATVTESELLPFPASR